ncbi:hypothetical protein BKA67DRAFT_582916 [Truncatella angustata]|uniref:Uncharacterized protein n=1 Tax=Truncatella angustata TaxID=152316 RepID=A0A9P8RHM7_9PEZI|nr:uncharacterized protein BKA67DRAFT_582916 [Truncatella angustata]KAH6645989.1 hypothetical protein BKA67DRAFT_582916 [Truncatella angustata]
MCRIKLSFLALFTKLLERNSTVFQGKVGVELRSVEKFQWEFETSQSTAEMFVNILTYQVSKTRYHVGDVEGTILFLSI